MQITAHVSEMISRHFPKSDAEVQGLLSTCIEAVERGSIRMLDACESLCFSRCLFHQRKGVLGKSIYWLLRGVECASKLMSDGNEDNLRTDLTNALCYRHLTRMCADMSTELLDGLSKNSSSSSSSSSDNKGSISHLLHMIKQVKDVQGVIVDDEVSVLVTSDPSIALFLHVADIGWNILERNDKENAKAIIYCLEERLDVDGSVIILSPPGFYGYFLSLAFNVLSDEEGPIGEITDSSVAFDVNGMNVLFCCFERHSNPDRYGELSKGSEANIDFDTMRMALGKGLMRAFVSENAKMGKKKKESSSSRYNKRNNSSVDLEQYLGLSM